MNPEMDLLQLVILSRCSTDPCPRVLQIPPLCFTQRSDDAYEDSEA